LVGARLLVANFFPRSGLTTAFKIGQKTGKSEEKREKMKIVNFLHFHFTKTAIRHKIQWRE